MPNQKIYILNHDLDHAPLGVVGEICIGGIGLAKNYWGNEKLTKQSFIQTEKLDRIYKTGDLGKWHKNGYIEYIGRIDSQVKIAGYRIELEEIEKQMLVYPSVNKAVAVVKSIGSNAQKDKYIIGYYVAKEDITDFKVFLEKKLAQYMIPKKFIRLDSLPLTTNGKVVKSKLPAPSANSNNYIAPRNELESKIAFIWLELLGGAKNKISIIDDFFNLGGTSILAIKLITNINKEFKLDINIISLYNNSTIKSLAEYIKAESLKIKNTLKIVEEGEI